MKKYDVYQKVKENIYLEGSDEEPPERKNCKSEEEDL